ncbi:ribonucleoside-diphosphate reductase class II [Aquimarina sp. MAR_2010_214]|uniref:adenosylcobalamin-dependent ribonucleoside-diphosphate reductase n=1 Tax=Aquimarina sp. MAR_2010_214 TaxID=1250026 RepID=UPI000C715206|nr:adenosylcobalamin-dependent ribonucleoside-diphosphate reductase [Aquimarina sp. MAR_2010_214]PKV50634.1 ribonucleoside-diphosphate reductase class II [Aquimarina sp. MAR_2010_214]
MEILTDNTKQILQDRYLLKDDQGAIVETPKELFWRVAKFVASAENEIDRVTWEARFYNLLSNLNFLPNSPTLMNAGLTNGQLSACFVLPIEDSLEDIFTTLKNAALIHQSGGGTGFNFSKLRPKNDWLTSSKGTSSGPVAFMKIYDAATEYVKQGGKRRGANMGILNIDHPDIEEFINSKSDNQAISNFNISVGITDDFMNAVEKDLNWNLINPRTRNIEKTIKASTLWQNIVQQAWKTGDPGLIYLDTINKYNPLPNSGKIQSTNPCGEVPLLDYESCNLGSINLSKMVIDTSNKTQVDWNTLKDTVTIAVRFLDNVISVNHYLLPEIERITKAHRKIGLGVMGWAELLIKLEIPYAADQAVQLAEKLMKFIKECSYSASCELAKEKGIYPVLESSIHYNDIDLRNATCNSIAPTGTISVIANTSYSIEPLFALAYDRVGILGGKKQTEINSLFVNKMKTLGLWNKEVKKHILKHGNIKGCNEVPNWVKKLFETSLEIPWNYHLLHQKAFQKYTDNAVSKTINLPKNATIEDVSKIYHTAWAYGLKGITIYRYGSKNHQVLQKCNLNTSNGC